MAASSGPRNQPRLQDAAIAGEQRRLFDDGSGRNDLVGRIRLKIEFRTRTGYLDGYGQHGYAAKKDSKLNVLEIQLEPA